MRGGCKDWLYWGEMLLALPWGVKFVPKLVDFIHPIFIPFDVAK